MIPRLLVASVGAVVITAILLLGMGEFASLFLRERTGDRYFLINDILPAPERRRLPRPPAAALPPESTGIRLPTDGPSVRVDGVDRPAAAIAVGAEPALPTPEDDFELVPE